MRAYSANLRCERRRCCGHEMERGNDADDCGNRRRDRQPHPVLLQRRAVGLDQFAGIGARPQRQLSVSSQVLICFSASSFW